MFAFVSYRCTALYGMMGGSWLDYLWNISHLLKNQGEKKGTKEEDEEEKC